MRMTKAQTERDDPVLQRIIFYPIAAASLATSILASAYIMKAQQLGPGTDMMVIYAPIFFMTALFLGSLAIWRAFPGGARLAPSERFFGACLFIASCAPLYLFSLTA